MGFRLCSGLVLAAVLIAVIVLVQHGKPQPGPAWQHAVAVEPPRALADFELIDHHQQRFDRDRFRGDWTLVMVGFTHCPDICPTGLTQLSILQQRLAEREAELGVVFVSVDPGRDTPETLAEYVGFFGQDLLGATGHRDQLRRLGDSLDFAWVRVPMGEGRYTVDHSGALALIDPHARLVAYFLPPLDLAAIEADLGPVLARR
jgi:protein SCO1/2